MQKTILWLFDFLTSSSLVYNMSHDIINQSNAHSEEKLLQILEERISYNIKLIFGEEDVHKALNYFISSYKIKKINIDVNMQMLDALISELLFSCKTNHDVSS